jgi:hypothetical protein
MPNWKKLITSGSDASLSSLTTSGNVSGSSVSTGSFGIVQSTGLTANETVIVGSDGKSLISTDLFTVDTANDRLGIGTTSPEVKLHIDGDAAQEAQIRLEQHNDTADAPDIRIRRSRGTHALPQTLIENDYQFRLNVDVYDGSSYTNAGQLRWDNDGTTDNNGTNNVFGLQTRAGGTTADRLTVDSSGDISIAGALTLGTALAVAEGGTGATTLTSNGILTGNGTSAIQAESNLTFDAATGNFSSGDGSESVTHEPSSNYLTVHETGASKGSHLRLATDNSDFILTAGGGTNQLSLYDVNGTANRLVVNSSGTFQFQQDVSVPATNKIYLDGGGNTYITEASSDVLDFYVGGVKMHTIDETNNLITMRGTGGSDGAAGSPTLRLSNTVESGDWDSGDVVGSLEYYVEDTSGNAPYVASFIKSVNPQENGTLPGGYLSFGTSPYNQSGGATEEFRMETDGDFHAVGDIVAYSSTPSDERLKDNVVTIDNSLDLVSQLRGVRFDWNIGSKEGQQDIGVIAQEIEKVIPEVVSEKKLPLLTGDDKTYKVVDYEKITAVLIESIKELKQEVDEIKQKCDCLNK